MLDSDTLCLLSGKNLARIDSILVMVQFSPKQLTAYSANLSVKIDRGNGTFLLRVLNILIHNNVYFISIL